MPMLNATGDGALTTPKVFSFLKCSAHLTSGKPRDEGNSCTTMMPDRLSGSLKPVGAKLRVYALNRYLPNSQPQARISSFADTDPREGVTLAWLQAQLEPLPPCPSTCP